MHGVLPIESYGRMSIEICKKCVMPSSRPRIVFKDGQCNACANAIAQTEIDWDARAEEFQEIIQGIDNDGPYDCIVPFSGGKDSAAIAHKLKFKFGLNPLLVTYSPMLPTKVGDANREAVLRCGFDNVFFRPDQRVSRYLAKRFFVERGNPEVHRAAGINALPVQEAVNRNIPLIFWAEHGESTYGGHVLSQEHLRTRDLSEVLEHQIGDHPLNWVDDQISERDLAPYIYPDNVDGVTGYYFSYFFPWNVRENLRYAERNWDFQRVVHTRFFRGSTPHEDSAQTQFRSDGTFTDYDSLDDKIDDIYFRLQMVKFGFGRATRDASRAIMNNEMTREEGLALAIKYDDEPPHHYINDVLEYLNMDRAEFDRIIDSHRNPEIWKQTEAGWELRYPPK